MRESFNKARPVVNYIWINKDPFEFTEGVICGVPLHYIDRAIENARMYPGAQMRIWLDYSLLDERSLEIVKDHMCLIWWLQQEEASTFVLRTTARKDGGFLTGMILEKLLRLA